MTPVTTEPHAVDAAAVAATLGVDPAVGLAAAEVERRARESGPNAVEAAEREPVWRMLLEALTEPFVLLLLAAGILAILLGEVRDGLLVLVGLMPIVGADVVTEYRGERALEALRDASAPTARVRRDGAVSVVQAATLVTGDAVLLQGGDVVPADLRLTRADRLLLDRSALTGESIPEPAHADADAADAPLASRRSMAYAGTSVVGGRGEGVVTAIGAATEVGRIAGGLTTKERRRSPLQRELARLVRILLVVAIFLIAFTTGMGFLRGHPAGENILAGISAAIAAIPEEPPILLAVVLGLGAYRLLKRGVLVRRLNAEETLGAIDLIVTDKTGHHHPQPAWTWRRCGRRTARWTTPRSGWDSSRRPCVPRRTRGRARTSPRARSRGRYGRRSRRSGARPPSTPATWCPPSRPTSATPSRGREPAGPTGRSRSWRSARRRSCSPRAWILAATRPRSSAGRSWRRRRPRPANGSSPSPGGSTHYPGSSGPSSASRTRCATASRRP